MLRENKMKSLAGQELEPKNLQRTVSASCLYIQIWAFTWRFVYINIRKIMSIIKDEKKAFYRIVEMATFRRISFFSFFFFIFHSGSIEEIFVLVIV